jgi:hypothetical protein
LAGRQRNTGMNQKDYYIAHNLLKYSAPSLNLSFIFRNEVYYCTAVFDTSAEPYYIFAILNDKDLAREFGEEIRINTDGEAPLPKRDDFGELVELRQAIFDSLKTQPYFISFKERLGESHLVIRDDK